MIDAGSGLATFGVDVESKDKSLWPRNPQDRECDVGMGDWDFIARLALCKASWTIALTSSSVISSLEIDVFAARVPCDDKPKSTSAIEKVENSLVAGMFVH